MPSLQGSTHCQVDEYSRRRTEEISDAVAESIRKIVAETQQHQQQLLADANSRTSGSLRERRGSVVLQLFAVFRNRTRLQNEDPGIRLEHRL